MKTTENKKRNKSRELYNGLGPDERMRDFIESGFYQYVGQRLIDCINSIEDTTMRRKLLTQCKNELQKERKRELHRIK